ncbi:MAG: enoyl-CoA hydratase-related protein [Melioribacteraceae bacterium]|nr:enoyl-CoA hydratase-related protein [Melioribacteraceae bacterium]
MFKNLLTELRENILIITINRPEKLNALNGEILKELSDAFADAKVREEIQVVIITGAGEKAFVAGADINELNKLNPIKAKEFAEFGQKVFAQISDLSKPVIAAVNGFALGGGCELAMACHIRLVSENAKFGQPEVNLGVIPGYGGTQRLPKLIGLGRAMELILSGDLIDANEAYKIGLANKVYPLAELIEKTIELSKKILSKSRIAVSLSINAINASSNLSEAEGMKFEAANFALATSTEDFKEGTTAFLEKRKAQFKGE